METTLNGCSVWVARGCWMAVTGAAAVVTVTATQRCVRALHDAPVHLRAKLLRAEEHETEISAALRKIEQRPGTAADESLGQIIWDLGRAYYAYVGLAERILVDEGLDEVIQPAVRRAQSAWSFVDEDAQAAFVRRLTDDLDFGVWDERFGHLRTQPEFVGSIRILVG